MVAHERLTEPRVTMEWLYAKRNRLSDLPAFLGPYCIINEKIKFFDFFLDFILCLFNCKLILCAEIKNLTTWGIVTHFSFFDASEMYRQNSQCMSHRPGPEFSLSQFFRNYSRFWKLFDFIYSDRYWAQKYWTICPVWKFDCNSMVNDYTESDAGREKSSSFRDF